MRKSKSLVDLLLIAILTFFLYQGALDAGFVWLDHSQIEEGECIIKNPQDLKNTFLKPLLVPEGKGNYYRPLFKISYTLDYLIYGLNPRGFHFTNLVIHILNLTFLYLIFLLLGIGRLPALLTCVLYTTIPLNVSPVVCLTARADILCCLFILISFFSFLKFEVRNKKIWLLISLGGYILALLSKETAIGLLGVMIFWIYLRKNSLKYILPYGIITTVYLVGRFFILGRVGTRVPLLWGMPYSTLLSSWVGFSQYIFKTFIPFNLSISDAFPRYNSIFYPRVLLSLLLVAGFLVFWVRYLVSKKTIPGLGLGWVLSFYIPISNIVPALHFWAERFFYIPEIGLMIILAYMMEKKNRIKKMVILILPVYVMLNLNYQKYFHNDFLLFHRALSVSRFSQEAHTMLGYLYMKKHNYPRAVFHYTFALQDFPYYYSYVNKPEILNNLGVIFMRLKEYQKARSYFLEGLKIAPDNETLITNLRIVDKIETE